MFSEALGRYHRIRLTRRQLGWLLVVGLMLIAVDHAAVLLSTGAPPTVDGGNWLAFADDMFGRDVRYGMVYPPLVPFLVYYAVQLVGPTVGITVVGLLAWSVPAAMVYLAGRRSQEHLLGLVAALAILGSSATGEELAWGGFPQLLAIGAAIPAALFTVSFVTTGQRRDLAIGLLAYAVVASSSHLVIMPTIAALVLAGLLAALRARERRAALRRWGWSLGLWTLVAAPLLPIYVTLARGLIDAGDLARVNWADIDHALGAGWLVYALATALAPIVLLWIIRTGQVMTAVNERLLLAAAGLSTAWMAALLATGQPRYLHDLVIIGPLAVLATAVSLRGLVGRLTIVREMILTMALLGVLASTYSGLTSFATSVDFYRILDPGTTAAIVWIDTHTPVKAIIAVPDRRGTPYWWAEGLGHRRAFLSAELRWLRFADERSRAITANTLFYLDRFPSAISAARAAANGIGYILLPARVPWQDIALDRLPAGWSIAFQSGGATVIATGVVRP